MHTKDSLWMLFLETRVISSEGDGSCQLIFFCPGIPELFCMDIWGYMGSLGSHYLVFWQAKSASSVLPIPGVVYFPA